MVFLGNVASNAQEGGYVSLKNACVYRTLLGCNSILGHAFNTYDTSVWQRQPNPGDRIDVDGIATGERNRCGLPFKPLFVRKSKGPDYICVPYRLF